MQLKMKTIKTILTTIKMKKTLSMTTAILMMASTSVAQVVKIGEVTYNDISTVNEVLANASSEVTVTLLSDAISIPESIFFGSTSASYTLDLNGKTMVNDQVLFPFVISEWCSLRVTGEGKLVSLKEDASVFFVSENGNLTIDSGEFESARPVVEYQPSSMVTIDGGVFASVNSTVFEGSGDITVNDGIINGHGALFVSYSGDVVVNGGTFNVDRGDWGWGFMDCSVVGSSFGKATIKGGSFKAESIVSTGEGVDNGIYDVEGGVFTFAPEKKHIVASSQVVCNDDLIYKYTLAREDGNGLGVCDINKGKSTTDTKKTIDKGQVVIVKDADVKFNLDGQKL